MPAGSGGTGPSGTPGGGGGGGKSSGSTPGQSGRPDRPEPPSSGNPAPLRALERVSARGISAVAGTTFADPLRIRAENSNGSSMKGVRVQFAVVGGTGVSFSGGATRVTVTTGSNGVATAPTLSAGDQTGTFTVRATAVDRGVSAVDFDATVEAPPPLEADALVRTSDTPLTALTYSSFSQAIETRATYEGAPVAGLGVTATILPVDSPSPVESTDGPYFMDSTGRVVRTLTGLTTDEDGRLTLPRLFTDEQAGTFLLHLTTDDGTSLTIELNVSD